MIEKFIRKFPHHLRKYNILEKYLLLMCKAPIVSTYVKQLGVHACVYICILEVHDSNLNVAFE